MQYVVGQSATTWVLLVANDCHLETSGTSYRSALFSFLVVCSFLASPALVEKDVW